MQLVRGDHPGAALLAELTAARALVRAAREAASHDCEEPQYTLQQALAAYDEAMKASAS
jgi:hypothetical protein